MKTPRRQIAQMEIAGETGHHPNAQIHRGGLVGAGPGRDSGQRCWAVPPGLRAGETGLGCLPTHCAAWGRPFPFLGPVQPHGQLRIQMLGLVGNNGALEGPPSILCLVVRGGPGSGPRLCWVDTLGGQCLTSWKGSEELAFSGLRKVGCYLGNQVRAALWGRAVLPSPLGQGLGLGWPLLKSGPRR